MYYIKCNEYKNVIFRRYNVVVLNQDTFAITSIKIYNGNIVLNIIEIIKNSRLVHYFGEYINNDHIYKLKISCVNMS